jgi:hypothetical protein
MKILLYFHNYVKILQPKVLKIKQSNKNTIYKIGVLKIYYATCIYVYYLNV